MSVLIKDMEMPKNCGECELYESMYSSGCSVASLGIPNRYNYNIKQRPDWCPLVEVPEKHGRLIDADALIKALIRKEPFNDCARVVIAECMQEVRHARTVIEAEGEP